MKFMCWLLGHWWMTANDWVHRCPIQVCARCGEREDLPYSVKAIVHQPRA